MKVKVIQLSGKHDIIDQYIAFCHIVNDVVSVMGRTEEAMREIYSRCMNEDILREYMRTRRSEVFDMMFTLFDQDYADKMNMRDAKELGRLEGIETGMKEERGALILKMRLAGFTQEQIDTVLSMPIPQTH